ncbi:hypothetical protein ACOME3_008078 [Neoechinorhynchus agilis]
MIFSTCFTIRDHTAKAVQLFVYETNAIRSISAALDSVIEDITGPCILSLSNYKCIKAFKDTDKLQLKLTNNSKWKIYSANTGTLIVGNGYPMHEDERRLRKIMRFAAPIRTLQGVTRKTKEFLQLNVSTIVYVICKFELECRRLETDGTVEVDTSWFLRVADGTQRNDIQPIRYFTLLDGVGEVNKTIHSFLPDDCLFDVHCGPSEPHLDGKFVRLWGLGHNVVGKWNEVPGSRLTLPEGLKSLELAKCDDQCEKVMTAMDHIVTFMGSKIPKREVLSSAERYDKKRMYLCGNWTIEHESHDEYVVLNITDFWYSNTVYKDVRCHRKLISDLDKKKSYGFMVILRDWLVLRVIKLLSIA